MNTARKKIKDQVIVITGASSGIGLATAALAAERGAKVVLASRNQDDLDLCVDHIRSTGGDAICIVADVSHPQELRRVAEQAVDKYGRIDTWFNNAGISIYGTLEETPLEEKRRLFDVNFWGVVYGSEAALPHLKKSGGTLINMGSVLSERVIPLQGIYAASKHAVKAYSDALRMELEKEQAHVAVTLIKPAGINTPYTEHARNHLADLPSLPPPIYSPDVVARAVLSCAEYPRRDVIIGGAGKLFSLAEKFMPRLTDRVMEKTLFGLQQRNQSGRRNDALFQKSAGEGRVYGDFPGHVSRSSLYTDVVLHPLSSVLVGIGAGVVALAGLQYVRGRGERRAAA